MDAVCFDVGLVMTLLDVLLVVFVIAFIVVLIRAVDTLSEKDDQNDYNLERGSQDDVN